MNMPTELGNSPHLQRRHLLQSLGITGMTAVAGCLGGDDSEPDPEPDTQDQDQDSETDTQDQEQEPENYDTPESEHIDTETLIENWGTTYSLHERDMIDSFSPSQVNEKYDTTWTDGNYATGRYDVFSFSHEDIPETVIQETPDSGNHNILKVDQIPSGASKEDMESALEESGYTKDSELGEFSIYTTVDEKEARAVGGGKHIIAFHNSSSPGPATNVHMDYLNQALEDHRADGTSLHEDVQDLMNTLDVRNSFTALRSEHLWTDFVSGFHGDQPSAGAVTVDFDDETKYAAWKFGDEETAQQAYESITGSNGEISNGFTQVDQEGQYLTAAGGYELQDNFEPSVPSSTPII